MSIWKKIAIGVGALIAFSIAISPFLPDEEEPDTTTEAVAPIAQEAPTEAPTATPVPEPTEEPIVFTDDEISVLAFRSLTRNLDVGTSDNLSDQEIIDFAGAACDLAELSNTAEDLAMFAMAANNNTGMTNDDAAYVMGALVGAFCPDEADRLGFG